MRNQKAPSVKGRGLKLRKTTCYSIRFCGCSLSRSYMVPDNGRIPSRTTERCFLPVRLGSDIPQSPTHTGLAPSPARCDFGKLLTVFVIVFLLFIGNYMWGKRNCQGKSCFPFVPTERFSFSLISMGQINNRNLPARFFP